MGCLPTWHRSRWVLFIWCLIQISGQRPQAGMISAIVAARRDGPRNVRWLPTSHPLCTAEPRSAPVSGSRVAFVGGVVVKSLMLSETFDKFCFKNDFNIMVGLGKALITVREWGWRETGVNTHSWAFSCTQCGAGSQGSHSPAPAPTSLSQPPGQAGRLAESESRRGVYAELPVCTP